MATNLAPFAGTLGGDGVFMDGWWANFLVKTATRLCKKSLLIHLVFSLPVFAVKLHPINLAARTTLWS